MAQILVHKDGDTTIEVITNGQGDYGVALHQGIHTEWFEVFKNQDQHLALARYVRAIADDMGQYIQPANDGSRYDIQVDYRLI